MSLKVLLVRPASTRITEILIEGVKLNHPNIEFTILESYESTSQIKNLEYNVIPKVDFFKQKISVSRKLKYLFLEILKFSNLQKLRSNAAKQEFIDRITPYYTQIIDKFDIINFHFLRPDSIDLLKFVPNNKKVLISLWGSDLFRIYKEHIDKKKEALDRADMITVHSEEMKTFLLNQYGVELEKKVRIVLFGNSFQAIDLIKQKQQQEVYYSKIIKDINNDKIVVTLSHSGIEIQQHLKVLEELKKLRNEIKSQLYLIVPLSYGGSEDYRTEVKEAVLSTGISNYIISEFLSLYEVLEIKKRADIHLNLCLTDSLNNAMIESLLFNKIVIAGAWLPYKILAEHGIHIVLIDSISELNEKIEGIILNRENFHSELFVNQSKTENLVSNKFTGEIWGNYYIELAASNKHLN